MRELGPDRVSDDGENLVLRDPTTGLAYTVPIDDRMSRLLTLAEQRRRPGQHGPSRETTMQSSLSPREIQTRIRRGETLAEVADAAGVELAQIEGFATPVLAERAYMAEQARATTLRRKHVGGAPVALGTLVDVNLSESGAVPDAASWDAWRREDGRWAVVVTPEGQAAAHFIFDVTSRYVLPADDVAHGLVGDVAHPDESSDMALADAIRTGGPEIISSEVISHEQVAAENFALHAPVASLKEARDRRAMEQMNQPSPRQQASHEIPDQLDFDDLDDQFDEPSPQEDAPSQVDSEPPSQQKVDTTTEPSARSGQRKHERRRVPSWDEIMFGGRDA